MTAPPQLTSVLLLIAQFVFYVSGTVFFWWFITR